MKKIVIVSILLCVFYIASCQKEHIWPPAIDKYSNDNEYVAIFGDIQYYTNKNYISLYANSLNWLLAQKVNGMNIKFVLHTGDITQSNSTAQYSYFYTHTSSFAQRIPYYSLIGDHDYQWKDGGRIYSRDSTKFNDYVQFPKSLERIVARFDSSRMENIVFRYTLQGRPIDFMLLEFGPRDEVVNWAVEYISTHSTTNIILCNHEYLEKGGGRRTENLKCKARLRNTTYNTPDQLWVKAVKPYDNVAAVLCGHVGGLYAVTVDTNDFGHPVTQIQHNIQSPDYRYDNWLMMWEFPSDTNIVDAYIVNTHTGEFYNNDSVLFSFQLRDFE